MDMGQRFRRARREAGLTQAQLCQGVVSRNMLSQIEGGTAKPSLSTLEILAERLHKPASYFLGEESGEFSGRAQVEAAWKTYQAGKPSEALRLLKGLKDREAFGDVPLLRALILLDLAEQAMKEKRYPYAGEILRQASGDVRRFPALKKKALLLQGMLEGQRAEDICRELPSVDLELFIRAKAAMETGNPERAAQLLEAAEDKNLPRWAMLRGKIYEIQGHFRSAVRCFHQAEEAFPKETAQHLEACYRELEDYKQAYYYACRQK